jgi:ketosteroid isomerase-like protein
MRRLHALSGLALSLSAVGILCAAGGRAPVYAQQPADIRSVIASYRAALTTLDVQAVGALFDDGVVVNNFGDTARGKADAIALLQGAIAGNPNLKVTLGDTVYILDTAVEREAFSSDVTAAAGVSRVMGIETIVVLDGKIVSYTAAPDLDDPETARFVAMAAQQ